MITWKAHKEPIQINDAKFSGLHFIQVGWAVLRGINLASEDANYCPMNSPNVMMSTSLQSYYKVTLELQDNIADQDLQVGVLTDFVVSSHDAITDAYCNLIHEVLVEED
ncbi:unnamed protein product [Peronospora belbahrii]|uniref:Uncharacterized protein n=1 Tax=Peronospora belbahrii TaxID=622444 RepID=A0AAU9KV68_9STRA|nr:unnamed protein product [Peronospora belbahrii]CAH0517530.1 unnamed protein product [Peronospora belbahrii]